MAKEEDVDAAEDEAPVDDGDPNDDAAVVEDAGVAEDADDTEDTADADAEDPPRLVAAPLLLLLALDDCTRDELLALEVPLPATEPDPLPTDEDPGREDDPVDASREDEDVDAALELPNDTAPDEVELVPATPELPPPGATGVPQPASSASNNPIHARGFTWPPIIRATKQAPCRATPARWNAALQTRVTPGVTFR